MRLVLTAAIAASMLAGCTGYSGKLADANMCQPSKPASYAVTNQFFPLSGLDLPGRSVVGGGKTNLAVTMTYACVDPKRDKTNAPIPNLDRTRLPRAAAI